MISKRVDTLKTTVSDDLIHILEMEELFDEIYGIFKAKMDVEMLKQEVGDATPVNVLTIIGGKLVPVDLNIAISCGDLGMNIGANEKGTSLFNTRETKKKPPRLVGTFIKGKLVKVDIDSIEAKEEEKK